MNVLITGSSGFIGSRLSCYLQRQGHRVIGMSRTKLEGDLRVLESLPPSIDVLIHSAASLPDFGKEISDIVSNNVFSSRKIVELSKKTNIKMIIYLSSISVYGTVRTDVVDEVTELVNPNPYGMSKRLAELIFEDPELNASVIILRLPAVLGAKSRGHWLSNMVLRARLGEEVEAFNPESLFSNAIYVEDLCTFVASLLDAKLNKSDLLVLSSSDPISIRVIATCVAKFYQLKEPVFSFNSGSCAFQISSQKAQEKYGFVPKMMKETLESYLCEMVY